MTETRVSDDEQPQDLTNEIRDHLTTIIGAWSATAEPMTLGHGTSSSDPTLPSSTIVLRADITRTLAFWVHAMLDEWPAVLQHLERGADGNLVVVTGTLDCTDVPAMADLLRREAERLADWGEFSRTIAKDLAPLAKEASLVSQPPKRDRITLGDCPACGMSIRAVAVRWVRLPHPTTDPTAYPPWTPWQPRRDKPIECPGCKTTKTLTEWQAAIVGPQRLLSASELVELLHARLGMRVSTAAIRQWTRREVIAVKGYARDGRALFDRVQVLAALVERDRQHVG